MKQNPREVIQMIGVIGGVGFSQSDMFREAQIEEVDTHHGKVTMLLLEKIAFVPRHGKESNIPPHMVNHKANLSAFKEKGIQRVIGINSAGSLNYEIMPPAIMIPHDYIGLWDIATFHDHKTVHIVPGLDEELRQDILSFAEIYELGALDSGIYIQTSGPRLETKAEVRMLSKFADIVGMTLANEATLAKELGLKYASICSVDNYAHGITDEPFTNDMILENAKVNSQGIAEFLLKLVEELK
jgi:5'-methylthioadenosine phosphorylase